MNRTPLLLLGWALSACTGSVNQGTDLGWKNDDSSGADSATDSTGGDDSVGGDDSTDSPIDSDPGSTWAGSCGNYWDPVDLSNWTRSYAVTYNGSEGTEDQASLGEIGDRQYRFSTTLKVATGDGWAGTADVACDFNGEEGLFMTRWEVEYATSFGAFLLTGDLSPARLYLPDEAFIGGLGSWNYDYSLTITYVDTSGGSGDLPFPTAVTGTFVELGEVETTVGGETVNGYRLTNTYSMSSEGLFTRTGYIDQTWVPGIGLVYEKHTAELDDGKTSEIVKTLTSYTGLEIIQP